MEKYLALEKVLETGGFSKAARTMDKSQSSVSQMILSLEEELGLTLLSRSKYGAHLSAEGERIYPEISRLLESYRAVLKKTAEIKGLGNETIRIGTISSVTCHWMPDLVSGFQKIYPDVKFEFEQGDYTLIPEWIRSGKVDFGFVAPAACGELEYEVVKSGEMLAIVSEKNPLARKKSVTLKELSAEPFIELEEGGYSEIMEAFEKAGISPAVKYRLHDDYAIMTMVEAGLGVSILARLVLSRTNFRNVCLPVDPPITRTLAIAYKDKENLPLACRKFISFIMRNRENLA